MTLSPDVARMVAKNPRRQWMCERNAWMRPTRTTVSAWCRENIHLPAEESSKPGYWTDTGMGYAREIMDVLGDDETERVTMMCAAQVGKTSILRNWFLYLVDQKPGNALMVMARETDAFAFNNSRLLPVLRSSPRLERYISPRKTDNTEGTRVLGRMRLRFVGANSPAGLASYPIQNLGLDEVDKYPPYSGREADPVSLAEMRTQTFHDRKIFASSTPTHRGGLIWQQWSDSDQRRYLVPCFYCGAYQELVMAQLRFDKSMEPDDIEAKDAAHYECEKCGREIREEEKGAMVDAGVWVPANCTLDEKGVVHGKTDSRHKGYHLSALYSPVVRFSRMAAAFLSAHRSADPAKLQHFRNSWQGWIWENATTTVTDEGLRTRILPYPRGTVPAGGVVLTAGVDVQQDLLYYAIRAWGAREHSWLVDAGRVERWEELRDRLFRTGYRRENGEGEMRVRTAMIDTGYRTDEVYQFCRQFPDLAKPIKGAGMGQTGTRGAPVWSGRIETDLRGRVIVGGMTLFHVDTNWAKDKLARCQQVPAEEQGAWWLHADVTDEYLQHIQAEHRVRVLNKNKRTYSEVWERKPGNPQNHWLDCEVYNLAAAEVLHVWNRIRAPEVEEEAADAKTPAVPDAPLTIERVPTPPPREQRPAVRNTGWIRNEGKWFGRGRR